MRETSLYGSTVKQFKRKKVRRQLVRAVFIGANLILLLAVTTVVLHARSNTKAISPVSPSTLASQASVNPLDQVSSADIAVNIARSSGLAEAVAVKNSAESADTKVLSAPTNDNVVTKPQIVATTFMSKNDIQSYTVQPNDTITSIASKFGVTSDSIRWSNTITGDSVPAGTKILVPPHGLSGIIYTVKAGDTIDNLVQKYKADKAQFIAANDAEINGIKVGEQVIIPNGQQPVSYSKSVAPTTYYNTGFAFGSSPIYGYNGYDYGWCTWYVASKVSVPSNWGNANTWDNNAALSGWTVSTVPKPGAIAQTDRGSEGHVAYVEAVSDDGSMIKYSDMNGLAGWGRVGFSDWAPASHFQHYIYQ